MFIKVFEYYPFWQNILTMAIFHCNSNFVSFLSLSGNKAAHTSRSAPCGRAEIVLQMAKKPKRDRLINGATSRRTGTVTYIVMCNDTPFVKFTIS